MSIFCSYPGDWTKEQKDTFDKTYDSMVKGVFGWLDFIPPTDLAGAGTQMMGLSLKGLLQWGNMGATALSVGTVHDELLEGAKPKDVFAGHDRLWTRPGTGLTQIQMFYITLALERAVYGVKSAWKR